jgi:hypothetical protein
VAAAGVGRAATHLPITLGWAEPDKRRSLVSEQGQEAQVEARQDSDNLAEVRAYGERQEKRAKELEAENAELRKASRIMGLRAADVDPESWLGKAVLDSAEMNNLNSIEDITNFARLAQRDAQGRT